MTDEEKDLFIFSKVPTDYISTMEKLAGHALSAGHSPEMAVQMAHETYKLLQDHYVSKYGEK